MNPNRPLQTYFKEKKIVNWNLVVYNKNEYLFTL